MCMTVSSWKFMGKSEEDTDCIFGLNLGKTNRKEYIEGRNLKQVSVVVENINHTFSLSRENFWTTCPELRDTDVVGGGTPIRDLLERLDALTWKKRVPARFELKVVKEGEFELVLPPLRPPGKVQARRSIRSI